MSANLLRKMAGTIPAGVVRFFGNLYPPYLGSAIRVTRVSSDYTEIDVRMKLTWYNRNYVGTQFGGSMYSMTDPFFMLMLINNLGKEYIVWDKGAHINFVKPGRGTVFAYFRLSQIQISEIKAKADSLEKYIFDLPINIVDQNNEVVAEIKKTMYVRKKKDRNVL
jgi:hypothetical protein